MSTAYHPQTDGQTERANQTLEIYLRHYINKRQNNWVQLLPMAQLTYNDKISQTTGVTPFFANYGKNANGFLQPREGPNADKVLVKAKELREVHKELRETIKKLNEKVRQQVNKNRKDSPQLKKGDKVYLLTRNMKMKRPSKKLDHIKVGPFLIVEQRGPVNYKLDLLKDSK